MLKSVQLFSLYDHTYVKCGKKSCFFPQLFRRVVMLHRVSLCGCWRKANDQVVAVATAWLRDLTVYSGMLCFIDPGRSYPVGMRLSAAMQQLLLFRRTSRNRLQLCGPATTQKTKPLRVLVTAQAAVGTIRRRAPALTSECNLPTLPPDFRLMYICVCPQ